MAGLEMALFMEPREVNKLKKFVSKKNQRSFVRGVDQITIDHGIYLLKQVQLNASRRPGPLVRTGRYLESWRLQLIQSNGSIFSSGGIRVRVFTDHPAARRLEKGFVGRDSLGRQYNQPPFPHLMPAAASISTRYFDALLKHMASSFEEAVD